MHADNFFPQKGANLNSQIVHCGREIILTKPERFGKKNKCLKVLRMAPHPNMEKFMCFLHLLFESFPK